jgi:hypothetical protein
MLFGRASLAMEQAIRAQFSDGLGREFRFRPTGARTRGPATQSCDPFECGSVVNPEAGCQAEEGGEGQVMVRRSAECDAVQARYGLAGCPMTIIRADKQVAPPRWGVTIVCEARRS